MNHNREFPFIQVKDTELKERIVGFVKEYLEFMTLPPQVFVYDQESVLPSDVEGSVLYFLGSRVEGYCAGEKVFAFEDSRNPRFFSMALTWLLESNTGKPEHLCSAQSVRKRLISVLEPFIVLMEVEDERGYSHSQRVSNLFVQFSRYLGLPKEDEKMFLHYSMLHDVGRIGLEQLMLYSPTRLRNFEETGQDHTITGSIYLSTLEVLDDFIPFVRSHHERFDGRGFPDRLKAKEIPYWVRVFSIVNWYDNALNTVDSEFSTGVMSSTQALSIIREDGGKMFDPHLASEFVHFMLLERDA
ncbi:MAG TPA: HD domain-containing phosphohydrolase [Thermotogota bacterium]|nr:HD domain-containing phosphohydrolase [Thermotogota bacterium]HRW91470.1 HD domain-containing phosphohydrolase [Thermotogota bacterium]